MSMRSDADFTAEALHRAAVAATLAPSVHNTQPWRLRIDGPRLDVRADFTRRLPVLDPTGRQLMISCGGAIMNARVALAGQGLASKLTVARHLTHNDLVASVSVAAGPPDWQLAELAPLVADRRTNRHRFTDWQIGPALLETFAAAAAAEGALLKPVHDAGGRTMLATLSRHADDVERRNPAYRAELRAWTTDDPTRRDGVPLAAVPRQGAVDRYVPMRAFEPGDDEPDDDEVRPADVYLPDETFAVLATTRDDPAAWLRAGQALERVWLEITRAGCATSPVSQIIEVPVTRARMRSGLRLAGHPHLLLRIGRAPQCPPSPRRRLADVLEDADPHLDVR